MTMGNVFHKKTIIAKKKVMLIKMEIGKTTIVIVAQKFANIAIMVTIQTKSINVKKFLKTALKLTLIMVIANSVNLVIH
jgi:hypothetical protein